MNTLVVSDAHLNVAEDGRECMADFVLFLRQIDPAQVDRLIVLGDLFDFWFEYKQVIFAGYFDVLRAFKDLRDAGVHLYFVCGNHDFWAGRFLREQIGFTIERNTLPLPFGERRGLLVHGDGIDPKDRAYRAYKWVAQARPVVWLFRLIHPDWAMWLAQRVARSSRHLFMEEEPSEGSQVKPLQDFAVSNLANGKADIVLCGHSHHAVKEFYSTPSGTGLYVNTGDWAFHRTFVEWDGDDFHIRMFADVRADNSVRDAHDAEPAVTTFEAGSGME